MKSFFVLLLLSILICTARAQNYGCVKLRDEEITRQGYSGIVDYKEKKSFNILQGITFLNGYEENLLADVFVEVFTYNPKGESKRVAGCRTDISGRFSFPNIPKGDYKIRLSKEGGFMITEILVKISPKNKSKEKIKGIIHLGV